MTVIQHHSRSINLLVSLLFFGALRRYVCLLSAKLALDACSDRRPSGFGRGMGGNAGRSLRAVCVSDVRINGRILEESAVGDWKGWFSMATRPVFELG